MKTNEEDLHVLVTDGGHTYPIHPVSEYLINKAVQAAEKRFRALGKPLSPPQYEVEMAGGAKKLFDHDEKSVQGDPVLEAEWAAYQAAKAELAEAQELARMQAMLSAIDVEVPDDDGWKRRQLRLGIEIPEDAAELWWHYLTTEVIVTYADMMQAVQKITLLTNRGAVKEEDLNAVFDSFQRDVQQNTAQKLATDAGTLGLRAPTAGSGDGA